MGKPFRVNLGNPDISSGSTPREVKHLSTWRKRKKISQEIIPLVAASETGGAQTEGVIYYVFGVVRWQRSNLLEEESKNMLLIEVAGKQRHRE